MVLFPTSRKGTLFTCNPPGIQNDTAYGGVIKLLSKERRKTVYPFCRNGFRVSKTHSHSTNPIIWGCIFYVFTGKIFANLLMFHPLFLAAHLLSIKIVSQKAEKCNHIPCLLLNYLLCVPVTSVTVNCRE